MPYIYIYIYTMCVHVPMLSKIKGANDYLRTSYVAVYKISNYVQ